MKSRNVRVTTALVTFGLVIALAGLIAPTALGASGDTFVFLAEPRDAKAGETITSAELNDATSFVRVQLQDGSGVPVTNSKALVTFTLAPGPGLASGTLQVVAQPLVNGVATFGPGTLKILTENEPQFTDYRLIPRTTKNPLITGGPSGPFDIWEDGESCTGAGDTCDAFLRGTNGDHYVLSVAGTLGASEIPSSSLPGLVCPGQAVVFANSVFSYATTQGSAPATQPVELFNHISKADWKASANNGQAHAEWCIGLEDPWTAQGGPAVQRNTDGVGGVDLYVGLAPRCPSANPSDSAPCIVSQTGDGAGGSISYGWLPGGDPPRRT